MKQRHAVFKLLSTVAFSTLALPAFANPATQQVGTQSATINGNNNQVIQVINQVNISHPGLGRGLGNNARRGAAEGTVQDSYQGATVNGSGNSVYQESNQTNRQEVARPGQRNGQGRDVDDRYDDDDDDDDKRGRERNDGRGRDRDDDDD